MILAEHLYIIYDTISFNKDRFIRKIKINNLSLVDPINLSNFIANISN